MMRDPQTATRLLMQLAKAQWPDRLPVMGGAAFMEHIKVLGLTQDDAAYLLGVNPRTVRRWVEDMERIPGPADSAIRAWRMLEVCGVDWKPLKDEVERQIEASKL